jgi:hypothetical protein
MDGAVAPALKSLLCPTHGHDIRAGRIDSHNVAAVPCNRSGRRVLTGGARIRPWPSSRARPRFWGWATLLQPHVAGSPGLRVMPVSLTSIRSSDPSHLIGLAGLAACDSAFPFAGLLSSKFSAAMANVVHRIAWRLARRLDLVPSLLLQFLHPMLLIIGNGCGERHGPRHVEVSEGDNECFLLFRRHIWHTMPPSSPAYDRSDTVWRF